MMFSRHPDVYQAIYYREIHNNHHLRSLQSPGKKSVLKDNQAKDELTSDSGVLWHGSKSRIEDHSFLDASYIIINPIQAGLFW